MNYARIKKDLKYVILNCIINNIPAWFIRRFCYTLLGMKIGHGSRIGIKTIIDEPKRIEIGNNTIINEYCFIDGRGGLKIGNNVSISVYSKILSASHKINSSTFEYFEGNVIIEDRVWIGMNAIVLENSKLLENSVIGAGCVFKGTTLRNSIYIGNPAKLIKKRDLEGDYVINYNPYFR